MTDNQNNPTVQLPLIQELPDDTLTLSLAFITPIEYLDAPPVDEAFIQEIARYGVPPIVVCPDHRWESEYPNAELYYPMDGKRRMMALKVLADMNYMFPDGTHAGDYEFTALVYYEHTPESADALRLSFVANHQRSNNLITDVKAIKITAKHLGVDPTDAEGQKAIAKELNVSVQTIRKLTKSLVLTEDHYTAMANGQLSPAGLKAITEIRDKKDQKAILKRLKSGEMLSEKEIKSYNKATVQTQLAQAMTNQPDIPNFFESNPLEDAIVLLDGFLKKSKSKPEAVANALELLRSLL